MKFTTSTIILSILAASTQAWELTVWLKDGRHVTTHGTQNSGCQTYDFNSKYFSSLLFLPYNKKLTSTLVNSPVNKAVFKDSTFADTFELYEKEKCGGKVSYRSGDGTHTVTPARVIKSYKAY
jgi:hypothetical protein